MHRNVYWEKRTNNISFDVLKGNKNEHVIEKEKLHQKLIFDVALTILTFSSSSSSLPKIQKDTSSTFSYNKNEIHALYSYFDLHRMLSTKKKTATW